MNSNQEMVVSLVLMQVASVAEITEDLLAGYVNAYSIPNPLSDIEKAEVLAHLQTKLYVRMDRGACIKEKNHVSWYYSAKRTMDTAFWDRYRTYLFKDAGFNGQVIDAMDASTDEMMDMLGDPNGGNFQRRGLVIGDVQSGKTATYTALINKAADAGYRVIILLTGTIEKLRRQTQGRIDEGFIGLDSTAFNRDKDDVYVGVGNIDPSVSAWAITSTISDFNAGTASKLNGKLADINRPVLFVLKKNKSVLEKLERWLRIYNKSDVDQLPLLLIDDEADNASVNTRGNEDPTAINKGIRQLLTLFPKATYTGFTATPYANIFIDPDSEKEMLEDDLFPRDFIYALEPPSNYVGARNIFSDDGTFSYMLKNNDDCEEYVPEKHKKDYVPAALPESLKEAMASFLIANAVRDLRGDSKKHRSMLVNISRLIDVQNKIAVAVDGYIRDCQREIRNYYMTGESALRYPVFSFLKKVFDTHFAVIKNFEFEWNDVQKALHKAVAPIVVRTVNAGNAPKNLNYDENEEEGLRIIAVGGISLSRGLTLEGLCVSYFYRNSKMYDTLMQMGRWFGYRDKYADICQVWMPDTAVAWYSYISTASDELRREVRRMQNAGLTPRDFGLCVRSDINALLVTARNKMKTARDYTLTISLSGQVVETPYLHYDRDVQMENCKLITTWLEQLQKDGFGFSNRKDLAIVNPQILCVPKKYVIELLRDFKSHRLNMDFQTGAQTGNLSSIIESYEDDSVDYWDIAIASGRGQQGSVLNTPVSYVKRRFAIKPDSKALQMSGKGARLGSANFAKAGLKKADVDEIEAWERNIQIQQGKEHAFSQELYFRSGRKRNPLLVIYPVELSAATKNVDNEDEIDTEKAEIAASLPAPLFGLSVGIPRINGRQPISYNYKINLVKWRELMGVDEDFEEVDDTAEEE